MKITETKSVFPGITKAFTMNGCYILVGREGGKWHLSISHKHRYPTWQEIKRARYELCPKNISMVMVLPPESEFVNIHENCFHLWEEK